MMLAESTLETRGTASLTPIAAVAVVGGVLFVGLLGGFLFFCCRKLFVTQPGMQR